MQLNPSRRTRGAVSLTAAGALALGPLMIAAPASAAIVDDPIRHSADGAPFQLSPLGTFETGVFDASAAEIVTAHGDRLFVVNAQAGVVDVLDYSDPAAIEREFAIQGEGVANSVAVRADGLGVIAFEADPKTEPGRLVFFDAEAATAAEAVLGEVTVGALPDMVTISPDGRFAVVANEGEPADDFTSDPEGSVAVVTLRDTVATSVATDVAIADFHEFEDGGAKTLPADVRVFGPTPEADLPVSRNLEPEYVTVADGVAYVTLQEANAVAVVDLEDAEVTEIWPLGFKDHGVAGNGIDPSDRDPQGAPTFDIRTFEGLKGIYKPDGIESYTAGGTTYLVTANEGDAREWGTADLGTEYVEGARAGSLTVCATSPLAGFMGNDQLGRLNVTTENGFSETGNCYNELYAFGARSFSIWTTDGEQVFDSGDSLERITHAANPGFFNSNHSESNLEGRSDDKGPEPENLAIGEVDGRTYAFIGLERVGGLAVYDITDPADSEFVTYVNNRDFSISMEDFEDESAIAENLPKAGDLGAEGVHFIAATDSPTGAPLVAVGNEVSGTTTVFALTGDACELVFSDIPGDHTFREDIAWMGCENISKGWANGDGTFTYGPNLPTQRDAMAAFLFRFAELHEPTVSGYTPPVDSPFTDVPTSHTFYREIAWTQSAGISTGWANEDGTWRYGPNEPTLRDAMAIFLFRLGEYLGDPSVTGFQVPATSPFSDVPVGHTFFDGISWAFETGITTGWDDGQTRFYGPNWVTQRDAMAAFLHRYDEALNS